MSRVQQNPQPGECKFGLTRNRDIMAGERRKTNQTQFPTLTVIAAVTRLRSHGGAVIDHVTRTSAGGKVGALEGRTRDR